MKDCPIERAVAPLIPYAVLPLRLALGLIFFVHGADKLFGCFGGGGFNETVGMMQSLGLPMPVFQAAAAGIFEMMGGIFVLWGLMTRLGGLMIAVTMVVAIVTVHWGHGVLGRDGGFETPLADLAGALTLVILGGQAFSLDNWLKAKCCKKEA